MKLKGGEIFFVFLEGRFYGLNRENKFGGFFCWDLLFDDSVLWVEVGLHITFYLSDFVYKG